MNRDGVECKPVQGRLEENILFGPSRQQPERGTRNTNHWQWFAMKGKLISILGLLKVFDGGSSPGVAPEEEEEEGIHEVGDEASFFVMPGNALKSLQDELKMAIEDSVVSRGVMERFGYRSGEGMARNLKISTSGNSVHFICEMLPHLWAQSGFGMLTVSCTDGETIEANLKNSVEVMLAGKQSLGTCNFTKGYIAGLISELLKRRYTGTEVQCVSKGANFCKLMFKPSNLTADTAPEDSLTTQEKYTLQKGMCYLHVSKDGVDDIFDVFVDKVTHGYEGLCISRLFPQKIQRRFNIKNTPLFWLTVEKGSKNTIWYPHLGKIHDILLDFLKNNDNPVVLLDGVEFLITKNNYKNTLSFLQVIIEKIAINEGILLMPLHPHTLQEQELSLIERETFVVHSIDELNEGM